MLFWTLLTLASCVACRDASLGVGYNLLRGYPRMEDLGGPEQSDPGLLAHRQILTISRTGTESKFTPRQRTRCVPVTSTWRLADASGLRQYLLSALVGTDHPDNRLVSAAFSLNPEFAEAVERIEAAQTFDGIEIVSCTTDADDLREHDQISVSQEFARAVCSLPTAYHAVVYENLIEEWGTHVVVGVDIGIRKSMSHGLDIKFRLNKPFVIRMHLMPLTKALDLDTYWREALNQYVQDGLCPSATGTTLLQNVASNIDLALKRYPVSQELPNISVQTRVSSPTWPQGTYGLMRSYHGCPGGGVTWSEGWLYQDTEDYHPSSSFSAEIRNFLAGDFHNSHIRTEFCMKTNGQEGNGDWQKGDYCILKHGDCPTGFHEGFIYWDDEDSSNNNHHGGVLPDGSYTKNTQIFYCCREDSDGTEPSLPVSHPFVLVRHGDRCQNVNGMNAIDIFIHWDDEDHNTANNDGGDHPFDASFKNHVLHYCYYEPRGPPLFG